MSWLSRFGNLFRRDRVQAEIEAELQFHLESRIEQNLDAGMGASEARLDAVRRFGGTLQATEKSRDADLLVWLDTAIQDLRYSLRGMQRNFAFTFIAVVTLALTTGALTTVFNLANGFLFRPLPVEHPDELVRVSATRRRQAIPNAPVSWPDYVHFRDRTKTLAGLAASYPSAPLFVCVGNNAQEINGSVVSANYFPLLGVRPLLGRFFRQDEDAVPDRDRVAVISQGLWSRWFGASPEALGAAVKVNGTLFTVIGVVPASFRGSITIPSEIYIPTMMLRVGYRWCDDSLRDDCNVLTMIGRLAPGRTVEDARGNGDNHSITLGTCPTRREQRHQCPRRPRSGPQQHHDSAHEAAAAGRNRAAGSELRESRRDGDCPECGTLAGIGGPRIAGRRTLPSDAAVSHGIDSPGADRRSRGHTVLNRVDGSPPEDVLLSGRRGPSALLQFRNRAVGHRCRSGYLCGSRARFWNCACHSRDAHRAAREPEEPVIVR
jgi:hypothetical protein